MSRTYRKKNHYNTRSIYYDWVKVEGFFYYQRVEVVPTKKDLAVVRSESFCREPYKGWYMKSITKVRRANDREQFAKLKKMDDYNDFEFDDSRHQAKRKGIWWEIW